MLLSLIIIKCGGRGGSGGGTTEGEIALAWDSETDPAVAGYEFIRVQSQKLCLVGMSIQRMLEWRLKPQIIQPPILLGV